MKNVFLNRLRYIVKARGRHGTHSPFIYAFVERVLRNKEKVTDNKALNMLYHILNYIRPDRVIITTALYDSIRRQSAFNAFDIMRFDADRISAGTLYVFDISELTTAILNDIAQVTAGKIFVCNIHMNNEMASKWTRLSALNKFTYSVDCFSFGLLLNDQAFRLRQHFILK